MTHFSNCSYSSIQKIRNCSHNRNSSTNHRCKYTIRQVSHKTGDLMIICSIHFPGRCDGLLQKIGSMNALLILARFRFQPMKETRVFSKYRSNYIFIELLSENVWTLQVRYQWLRAFLTCVLWCACYVLRLHTNSIATNATKLNFR